MNRADVKRLQVLILDRGKKSLPPLRVSEAKELCEYALSLTERKSKRRVREMPESQGVREK
jgi:hypothetical protein